MSERKPTNHGYAILGLLTFGQPLSGYELRQWALGMVGHFYPAPAQSQIYRELAMLEDAELISSSPVAQTDRPDKVVYALTPAGQHAVTNWLESEPLRKTALKHHAVMRVFLGHNAEIGDLVEVLEAHRQSVLTALDELETLSVALTDDDQAGFAAIAADWTAEVYRGDLRGVDRTLKALTNTQP